MANKTVIDVSHVAKLANLPVAAADEQKFATQFTDTLKTVDLINELDTSNTPPTFQVTGLSNVTRPDQIDSTRILTQDQALSGATKTHNGYFMVPAVIDDNG
jgi:aspartyl-tRNA(Asn)/glutamyl-tRNA(Gln) amidotransferase subunit C